MNHADKDLCQVLHELVPEWSDEVDEWWYDNTFYDKVLKVTFGEWHTHNLREAAKTGTRMFPAYNLGWLVRKLPSKQIKLRNGSNGWSIQYRQSGAVYRNHEWVELAHTPENAAIKLLISLIKAGVIDVKERP